MDQFRNKFWYRSFRSRSDFTNTELEIVAFDLCYLDIPDIAMEFPSDSERREAFERDDRKRKALYTSSKRRHPIDLSIFYSRGFDSGPIDLFHIFYRSGW